VRHASGHQLVVAAFVEGRPAYRGSFIAQLTRRALREVMKESDAAGAQSSPSFARSTAYP
jgi:hypothetical protein